jgi:hypothetical protein
MSNLESTRDIARYFTMAGVQVRPEASKGLLAELFHMKFNNEKKHFLDTIISQFK